MKLETIARTLVGLGIAAVFATSQTATAQPCSGPDACGPGEDWIIGCGAGTDEITSSRAEVGIYLANDCSDTPNNFVLFGAGTVDRQAEAGGSIDTEITAMNLVGGSATLTVGAGLGLGGVLAASPGTILTTGDPLVGDSSFDIFFEFSDDGINFVYNQTPLVVQADITCVPPKAEYIHPQGQCIPLFDSATGGVVVAYLGNAIHQTFPIPTVSEWGLAVMALLVLTAGTVVVGRRRRHATA